VHQHVEAPDELDCRGTERDVFGRPDDEGSADVACGGSRGSNVPGLTSSAAENSSSICE
jgi:hypothetical protein